METRHEYIIEAWKKALAGLGGCDHLQPAVLYTNAGNWKGIYKR
jgi:hypothetical protein